MAEEVRTVETEEREQSKEEFQPVPPPGKKPADELRRCDC